MSLALSNFAFDNNELLKLSEVLNENNIFQIETVLTKIDDWEKITIDELFKYKILLTKYNLIPYSIQSLFYNSGCDDITDTKKIVSHFKKLILYAQIIGVKILVFGSPNLRKKNTGWEKSITKIFQIVDDLLEDTGITLVIEPNAHIYGGEFFNNIYEIVRFIKKNEFRNIRTMIDTHNSFLETSNPVNELIDNFNYINHIHISEPKLKIIKKNEFHLTFSEKLKNMGYDKIITYEVMKCDDVLDSIKTFSEIYY